MDTVVTVRLVGLSTVLLSAVSVGAEPAAPLTLATDRSSYVQRDVVKLVVTNTSSAPVDVVERPELDGSFATIELRTAGGQWRAIDLIAVANVFTRRPLKPGERVEYRWRTLGYNRFDTLAQPGLYRIRLGAAGPSNAFEVVAAPSKKPE
ncbi:MAG: hypothetical protein JNJ54_20245 [Myxococcaceae bacterium]|nr:hypothetical protein [Myxococcaceae bacterium]